MADVRRAAAGGRSCARLAELAPYERFLCVCLASIFLYVVIVYLGSTALRLI